jgi:hypothetical protein
MARGLSSTASVVEFISLYKTYREVNFFGTRERILAHSR